MDKVVNELLDRSPHPLPWSIAMIGLTILALWLHSVMIGLVAGVAIGLYFGDYRGRFYVMEAWRLQLKADYEEAKNPRFQS